MKRQVFRIVFLILMCTTLISCSANTGSTGTYDPTKQETILKTESTDMSDIAEQIMKVYLNEFKGSSVVSEWRLKDYKITHISECVGSLNSFRFSVFYSVKPQNSKNSWMAGNGFPDGSWIDEKSASVTVGKINDSYTITSMGTE